MAAREVGAESTSPCTWMKHLPNLLRNKANSQQYPSIYEDRRPKSIEDTVKTHGKGIASGQKCPWDHLRDQGNCSPRSAPAGPAAGLLEERRVNGSLPCQTRLEQHCERPGCLKLQGRELGRSGKPTETMGAGWGELRVGPCGTLTWTVPCIAGEVG